MRDLSELTANKAVEISIYKFNIYTPNGHWTCRIKHDEDGVKLEVESSRKNTIDEAIDEAVDKYLAIRPGVPEFKGAMIEAERPPEQIESRAAMAARLVDVDDEIPF